MGEISQRSRIKVVRYSVGKWEDDYTFVVQTSGIDERTWVDRAGRPHSDDLRVEERFPPAWTIDHLS